MAGREVCRAFWPALPILNMGDYSEKAAAELDAYMRSTHEQRERQAVERQRRCAKQARGGHHIEGLGQHVMSIDSDVAKAWANKEGAGVFQDKTFRRMMRNNHPEVFASEQKGKNVQVGYGS